MGLTSLSPKLILMLGDVIQDKELSEELADQLSKDLRVSLRKVQLNSLYGYTHDMSAYGCILSKCYQGAQAVEGTLTRRRCISTLMRVYAFRM